ncbi:hypothetical protein COV56_00720 [Candidatus Kuenenbacteria bacterium CG11_big_fil_rev_8_21_14_0_20_37_9]|uniref:Uncharacterized protein n=1 Tax=Candidatus Kuenenbacteria bacterium CG08_land_8_20_14_0_20_37_23 TaxID=1974617 RepID=A0A2M6XSX6_9BACT|nr:MAG: hypothetical protein COV56_00720 [Candidatus Kuenenbacteria bacterium CG11_big_fil_rev_8_21_14_0_20_37_9]PIU10738.1 MAG: hypothetical protein COT27_01515 [Candidatus Kuenenbacteria bacterium CG08_land_8_20_14_0_20_37_23]
MDNPTQKTIEEYIDEKKISQDKKEKVILAITDLIYRRNQKVIQLEKDSDDIKRQQYLRSIKEYDDIIGSKIVQIIDGHQIDHAYEF